MVVQLRFRLYKVQRKERKGNSDKGWTEIEQQRMKMLVQIWFWLYKERKRERVILTKSGLKWDSKGLKW